MGTVRNTAVDSPFPSSSAAVKKGGKRKAMASSKFRRPFPFASVDPEDLSVAHAIAEEMLDQKLASRDKWQICTQRNLSEIRSECMKVRRELARLEESIDTVQMQVEDGLAGYSHRRDELQQLIAACRAHMDKYIKLMDAAEQQLADHKETTTKQLVKMNKRVDKYGERLQALDAVVDEETLMAQLTGLQERYESDLTAAKEELSAQLDQRLQVAMDEMQRTVASVQEGVRRRERDDHDHEVRQKMTTNHVHSELDGLLRRLSELEHHCNYLASENAQIKQQLESSRKMTGSVDERVAMLVREVDRQARLPPPPPPMPSKVPPPPLPIVNIAHLEDKLYYMQRDLNAMAEDYSHWKTHVDGAHQRLREELASRIDETRGALFKALNYDSGKHEFENRRLKDACFDIRADVTDIRKEMVTTRSQLQMEIQAKMMALMERRRSRSRSRSRSPPRGNRRWRRLPPPPGPTTLYQDGEQSHYGPGFDDRASVMSRRQSRSRSRSHSPMDRSRASATVMRYLPLNRPGRVESPPPPPNELVNPPTFPTRQRPPRRPQRTAHEIIVIEEEEEGEREGECENNEPAECEEGEAGEEDDAPRSPDQDQDKERPLATATEDATDEPMAADAASPSEIPDVPATHDDLRVGAFLYACFGGAPTLEHEWATIFAPLAPRDQLSAAAVARFHDRHAAFTSFPHQLTQFVSKAIEARCVGQPSALLVKTADAVMLHEHDVPIEYSNVLTTIRHAWDEQLCASLADLVTRLAMESGQEPTQFHVAMPLTSSSQPQLDKYRVWASAQSNALAFVVWLLHHCRQPSWKELGWRETAPSVFLFLCLFDPVLVEDRTTLRSKYRLNATGKRVLGELWVHLLNKLPPFFFVECAWLDDQIGPPVRIPVLGVAHVLSTILLAQSRIVQEYSPVQVNSAIAHSVRILKSLLLVDGVRVGTGSETAGDDAVKMVVLDAHHELELELLDLQWIHLMGLGVDFFNVIHQLASAST